MNQYLCSNFVADEILSDLTLNTESHLQFSKRNGIRAEPTNNVTGIEGVKSS